MIVAHVPRHQQNTLRVLNVFLHLWNEESTYILYILYIIICVEALPWKTPWENMRKQSSLFLLSHPVTLYWFTSMPSTLKQCFFSVFSLEVQAWIQNSRSKNRHSFSNSTWTSWLFIYPKRLPNTLALRSTLRALGALGSEHPNGKSVRVLNHSHDGSM